MKRLLTVLALVLFAQTGGRVLAQSDPFVGTWQLNVEQSKVEPGPGLQSQTRTWAEDGKVTVEGLDVDGQATAYEYPVLGDNADYPTTGSTPSAADTISSNRIDAYTIDAIFSREGRPADTTRFTVSEDGLVLTVAAKGSGPDGTPMNNLLVYDKQ